MFVVSIKKNEKLTNQGQFPTMEEAQAWLSHHEGMKTFGEPARTVQQQVELSPAIIAEDGLVLQEAVTEMQEIVIPASYEVEIIDITSQFAQEAINAEAMKLLADTDWLIIRELDAGIPCPAEIKAQRQAARERIVK